MAPICKSDPAGGVRSILGTWSLKVARPPRLTSFYAHPFEQADHATAAREALDTNYAAMTADDAITC